MDQHPSDAEDTEDSADEFIYSTLSRSDTSSSDIVQPKRTRIRPRRRLTKRGKKKGKEKSDEKNLNGAEPNISNAVLPGTSKKPHDAPMPKSDLFFCVRCGMIQVAVTRSDLTESPSIMDVAGRVVVINWDEQIVLDKFIVPQIPTEPGDSGEECHNKEERVTMEVLDHRTHETGITARLLEGDRAANLSDLKPVLKKLLKGKILIGHMLDQHLAVLGLKHPRCDLRDTAKYRGFMRALREPLSLSEVDDTQELHKAQNAKNCGTAESDLQVLLQEILHWEQFSGGLLRDAIGCMELYKMARKEWEMDLVLSSQQRQQHSCRPEPQGNVVPVRQNHQQRHKLNTQRSRASATYRSQSSPAYHHHISALPKSTHDYAAFSDGSDLFHGTIASEIPLPERLTFDSGQSLPDHGAMTSNRGDKTPTVNAREQVVVTNGAKHDNQGMDGVYLPYTWEQNSFLASCNSNINLSENWFVSPIQHSSNITTEKSWDFASQPAHVPSSSSMMVSKVLEPSLPGLDSLIINDESLAEGRDYVSKADPFAHDLDYLFEKHLPAKLLDDDDDNALSSSTNTILDPVSRPVLILPPQPEQGADEYSQSTVLHRYSHIGTIKNDSQCGSLESYPAHFHSKGQSTQRSTLFEPEQSTLLSESLAQLSLCGASEQMSHLQDRMSLEDVFRRKEIDSPVTLHARGEGNYCAGTPAHHHHSQIIADGRNQNDSDNDVSAMGKIKLFPHESVLRYSSPAGLKKVSMLRPILSATSTMPSEDQRQTGRKSHGEEVSSNDIDGKLAGGSSMSR